MTRPVKIAILSVLTILGAGYYFYSDIRSWYQLAGKQLEEGVRQLRTIEQKVIQPPPLRGPTAEVKSSLTAGSTIKETNIQRQKNGLPPLLVNAKLTQAAQIKAEDMFKRQYFEHESPTGEGPGDLAGRVGYEYLMVGENLALGNYENDQALVEAWMNSPGHRENILNSKYTEIGVAVKRGTFEGRITWMAVQEFGRPMSDCQKPSTSLESQIRENKILLAEFEEQISAKRQEIDNYRPKHGQEYNQKVDEYNELVKRYNALVEETKIIISEYNNQVSGFNLCIQ